MDRARNIYREVAERWLAQSRTLPPLSKDAWQRGVEKQESQSATRRGLPPAMWAKTFDAFNVTPATRAAFEATRALARCEAKFPQVMLVGPYGTGKTHLAYAACNEFRERRWPFKFIRAVELMRDLRAAISASKKDPEAPPPEMLIRAYTTNFLLALDDFGKQQDTEYAGASLFDILDARYAAGHPTIITTNDDPEAISPAIASRWSAGIVTCGGRDQRVRYESHD